MKARTTKPSGNKSLASLASQIKRSHAESLRGFRTSTQHGRRTGQLLLKAKKLVKSQSLEWTTWVKKHCDFEIRMAQYYMRLAKIAGPAAKTLDQMTITEALRMTQNGNGTPSKRPTTTSLKIFRITQPVVAKKVKQLRKFRKNGGLHVERAAIDKFLAAREKTVYDSVRRFACGQVTKETKEAGVDAVHVAISLIDRMRRDLKPANLSLVAAARSAGKKVDQKVAS